MTDFGGGRVYIEAVANAGGFRRDLQSKIDAAIAGVKLTVPVEADPEHLRRSVETAVDAAGAGVDLSVPVHADSSGLREEVDAARIEAEAGQEIKIKVSTDRSGGGGGGGGGGGAAGGAVQDAESASAAWGEVGQHWMSVGQSLLGNVWVLGALAGGLDALASAGGAALGAIAPLAGVVAALPGAVAVGGASLGTMFLGLSGVTKAAGELEKQQQSAGVTARQYADQQRSAAERVQSARQALGNTEYEVGQQTVQAAQSVKNAEYNLQIAYRSERDALQGLMDARQAAARQLEDSVNAAKDAQLGAESAQLALEQARQQYAAIATDPNATKLQREQAQLAVDEAEQRLKEAQLGSKRAAEDNAKTQKRGIDGNLQVRAATEAVANSYHDVNQAVISLREAQQAQQRDAITGAQRISDAQRSLNDAVRAQREVTLQMQSTSAAANVELNKLSPAGRQFAQILHDVTEGPLKELKQTAQTALLPGFGDALELLSRGLLPSFKSIVTDTGHALGDMASNAAKLVTSGPFTRDFAQLGRDTAQIIREMTPALGSWLDILRNLAMGAMPMLERFAGWVKDVSHNFDVFIQNARDSGQLSSFFDKVGHTIHQWATIIGNLGTAIFNIFKAAYGPGDELNNSLINVTRNFAKWTGSTEGQRKMHDFFEQGAQLARALAGAVEAIVKGLAGINNNGALTKLFGAIAAAAPGIGKVVSAFSSGFVGTFVLFADALIGISEHGGPLATVMKVFFAGLGVVAAGALVNKALGLSKLAAAMRDTVNAARGSSGVIDFLKRLTGIGTPSVGRGGKGGKGGGIGGGAVGGAELIEAGGLLNEAAAALTLAAEKLALSSGGGGLNLPGKLGKTAEKDAEKGAEKEGGSLLSKIFRRVRGGGAERGSSDLWGMLRGGGGAAGEVEKGGSLLGRLGGLLGMGGGAAGEAGAVAGAAEGGGGLLSGLMGGGGAIGGIIGGEMAVPVVGQVAAAVTALGVGAYEAYKHIKPFHDAVNKTGHVLKTGFMDGVKEANKGAHAIIDKVAEMAPGMMRELNKLPGQVGRFFENVGKLGWRLIKDGVKLWIDVFVKFPIDVIKKVGHLAADFGRFLGSVLSKGLHALETEVPKLLRWFIGLPGRIIHAIGDLAGKFYNLAKWTIIRFLAAAYDKEQDVISWFKGLPGRIFDAIGNLAQKMYDFGKKILGELTHGVSDAIGGLGGVLGKVAGKVIGFLNPFGDTQEGPMSAAGVGGPDKMGDRLMQELGRGLSSAHHLNPALAKIARMIAAALTGAASTTVSVTPGSTTPATKAATQTAQALPKALQVSNPAVRRLLTQLSTIWAKAWQQLIAASGTSTHTMRGHLGQLAASMNALRAAIGGAAQQYGSSLQSMVEATTAAVDEMVSQIAMLSDSINGIPSFPMGGGYDPSYYTGPPLSVIHNKKQPKQTGLHSRIRAYATGGEVDAPVGSPLLALLHGGEYVLSVQMRQTLARMSKALTDNLTGTLTWLASHERTLSRFNAEHPNAGAALAQALRRQVALQRGTDIGVGSGLGHVFQEGAFQIYNARPEPAGTSIATRLRRLRLLGETPLPPSTGWGPYASPGATAT